MNNKQSQTGATLIIVLLVLLMVVIIAVVSVRQSMTNLDVSTASQVNNVLFQAGDAALMKIEKQDRLDSSTVDAGATLRGKMMQVPKDQQIVFCLRPRQASLFEVSQFSQRLSSGKGDAGITYNSTEGFCNPSNADDFISPNRVLTQVYLLHEPKPENVETFSDESQLTGSNDLDLTGGSASGFLIANRFNAYTVSVLPAFSSAKLGNASSKDLTTVSGCLKQPINGSSNVDECLRNIDAPYHTQMQEYESTSKGFPSL